MSPLATPFWDSQREYMEMPCANPLLNPADISITPQLKSAFLSSLREQRISLRFFSGSWESFDVSVTGGKYDIVLTSETIYRTDSLSSLIRLLRAACGCEAPSLQHLSSSLSSSSSDATSYLCLVAAKVIYFGVGGGLLEFLDAVYGSGDHRSFKAETVWESKDGVGRQIVRMGWNIDNS